MDCTSPISPDSTRRLAVQISGALRNMSPADQGMPRAWQASTAPSASARLTATGFSLKMPATPSFPAQAATTSGFTETGRASRAISNSSSASSCR